MIEILDPNGPLVRSPSLRESPGPEIASKREPIPPDLDRDPHVTLSLASQRLAASTEVDEPVRYALPMEHTAAPTPISTARLDAYREAPRSIPGERLSIRV